MTCLLCSCAQLGRFLGQTSDASHFRIMGRTAIAAVHDQRYVCFGRNCIKGGVHRSAANFYTRRVDCLAWNAVLSYGAQPKRIGRVDRVAPRKAIQIEPARQPNGIFLRKPPPAGS